MASIDFSAIQSAVAGVASDVKSSVVPGKLDLRTVGLWGLAVFFAVAPLEISHILCALLGAGGYLFVQAMHPTVDRRITKKPALKMTQPTHGRAAGAWPRALSPDSYTRPTVRPRPRSPAQVQPELRTPSVMPVAAPTFQAVGWEAEVEELLSRLVPTPESEAAIMGISQLVKRALAPILPEECKISCLAGGSLNNGAAFGVAVPELDIVVSVDRKVLESKLHGHSVHGRGPLDVKRLYKSALRACTDRLVSTAAFKFRRSAFREDEPKVTLLAPALRDNGSDQAVPLNLSVNSVTPLYGAALLEECSRKEPKAKALVLLVRRWAKDRGISHAAKGHLSPYTWTLVVIYFLQAGLKQGASLLPPVRELAVFARVGRSKRAGGEPGEQVSATQCAATDSSLGELLKAFFHFFAGEFDWQREVVSPRLGCRAAPESMQFPPHIILQDDGHSTEVGPSIEDPFEQGKNLGTCLTAQTFARLREEFQRADGFSGESMSLASLLEPWAPAEVEKEDQQ